MKNRKFVKLKVDMYSDTKFKIIDTMENRDLIHYIWIRLVTLCGQVNLDGDLYMSKPIPYTPETLEIEFNRIVEKVKLALKVFIDLEMLKISKDNVYQVTNFAKHKNIKGKKTKEKSIEENIKVIEAVEEEDKQGKSEEINMEEVKNRDKLETNIKNEVINFGNKCDNHPLKIVIALKKIKRTGGGGRRRR